MQLKKKSKGGGVGKFLLILLLGIIIAGGGYIYLVFFENSPPQIELSGDTQYVGKSAHFFINAKDDNSGLRSLKIVLMQGDKEYVLLEQSFARKGYTGQVGQSDFSKDIPFDVGETKITDGEAFIIATAKDYSLRHLFSGNTSEIRKKVTVDTKPPVIRVLHAERYIRTGGSGIVIYQLDDGAVRHGAEFAGNFHAGYPVGDGRDNVYIAYIAVPYDVEEIGKSSIIAQDAAGNQSSMPFSPVYKKIAKHTDKIAVGDGFLSAKIPEFEGHYSEMTGSMVDKYLYANRSIRKANNEAIANLCKNPSPERMWSGAFLRMAGASKAGYADYRTYYYKGKEIDSQVHLGMDIASTQRAAVKAANTGKVVYADYLGIYGNMIMLDHGQGVFSLYSHLSSIQVAVGDIVKSGVVMGQTGNSGMAGGDHLHFSMLINGIFVTPKEWWDQQWVEVTIDGPLSESKF